MNGEEKNIFHFFMTVQACLTDRAKEAYENLLSQNSVPFYECIDNVNRKISQYDLEIVSGVSEVTGKKVSALVNISATNSLDETTHLFNKKTLQYFSAIMKSCILSDEGCISEIECINLSMDVQTTKIDGQSILQELIERHWIESQDGKIYLGVRTLQEFGQLLATNFSDRIKKCPLCMMILLHGDICDSCGGKVHKHCLSKYFQKNSSCPLCKSQWETVEDTSGTAKEGQPTAKRSRLISD